MTPFLLENTLRGSLVTLVVLALDWMLTRQMRPSWRRSWWLIVPFAWLLPLRLPKIPREFQLPFSESAETAVSSMVSQANALAPNRESLLPPEIPWIQILNVIVVGGAAIALVTTTLRAMRTARRWSGERLCTDSVLLALLEDCKSEARVTAPIGLIVTSSVSTPVLLGWLRPRILLPKALVESVSKQELRGILLHELAHFHVGDVLVNWLFCVSLALNWFNPLAHFAVRRWRFYCELAADEAVVCWSSASSRDEYGQALIKAIRHAHDLPVPQGAFALGESFEHIKERLRFVVGGRRRSNMAILAAVVTFFIVLLVAIPSRAGVAIPDNPEDAEADAARVSSNWLRLLEEGKFDESWGLFSPEYKKVFTLEQWTRLNYGGPAWGKCISRKLTFSNYAAREDMVNGSRVRYSWVTVRYDSVHEKTGHRWETITLVREGSGQWRIVGCINTPR